MSTTNKITAWTCGIILGLFTLSEGISAAIFVVVAMFFMIAIAAAFDGVSK